MTIIGPEEGQFCIDTSDSRWREYRADGQWHEICGEQLLPDLRCNLNPGHDGPHRRRDQSDGCPPQENG